MKAGKKPQNYLKMLMFDQTYMEFDDYHDNVKNDRRTIDTS